MSKNDWDTDPTGKKPENQEERKVDAATLTDEQLLAEMEKRKGSSVIAKRQAELDAERDAIYGNRINVRGGYADAAIAAANADVLHRALNDRSEEALISPRYANSTDEVIRLGREECHRAFLLHAMFKTPIRSILGDKVSERLVRTLSSSDAAGGYLIPPGYINELVRDPLKQSDLFARVRKMPVVEPVGEMPTVAANTTAYWGSENTEISSSDPVFGTVTYALKRLNVKCDLPLELARDTNPDIVPVVRELLTEGMNRERDRTIAVGNASSGQPTGLYSASGITTVASITTLTYANVKNLKYSVDPRYHGRPGFCFVCSPNVLAGLMGVVADDSGIPIFTDAKTGKGPEVLGVPVIVEHGCPDNFLFVGDLGQYLWFHNNDMGFSSTTEGGDRWDKNQIGLKTWERVDGKPALSPTVSMARTRVLTGVADLI